MEKCGDNREVSHRVKPRRRFVLGVVVLCLLAVLVLFSCSHCFVPEFFAVFMVEVSMLILPSRTKSGTLVQLLGLLMPCSAVAILLFGGMEEAGMHFPQWIHMVMTPLALIFWEGVVLYPFSWALIELWRVLVVQKMQK